MGPDFFKSLLDNLNDGIFFADRQRRILYWNHGAERISGFSEAEVVGRFCFESPFCHGERLSCIPCCGQCPLSASLNSGIETKDRVYLRHKSGRLVAVEVHAIPVQDPTGTHRGIVQIFRDASTTVALELAYGHLRALVEKDSLTGVASRRHLDAFLNEQISVSTRDGHPFCVILADLDRFKRVNDTWGHDVGDQLLVAFAGTLRQMSRASDLVGRFGGEEFLVILPGSSLADTLEVAERMRQATLGTVPPGQHGVRTTASFGVAEARVRDTSQSLLRRADQALYSAKRRGRNRVESRIDPRLEAETTEFPATSMIGLDSAKASQRCAV